jgi:non-homologous end joining protein Ku
MSSPRTVPNGTLSLQIGLVSIPVTLGKAVSVGRERSLMQVAVLPDGRVAKIDRSERVILNDGTEYKGAWQKSVAVQVDENDWRVLSENEVAAIENATKNQTLEVLDVQPLRYLPVIFSTDTFYVRHDKKSKAAPKAFAYMATALAKTGMGLVCKWGSSSRERLCVISVESGVMLLRVIPFLEDLRLAGDQERAHWKVEIADDDIYLERTIELLNETRQKQFSYRDYRDEGLHLRQAAVDRILAGLGNEKDDQNQKTEAEEEPVDYFAELEKALSQH